MQAAVYSKMTSISQQLQARRDFVNSMANQLSDVDEELWTDFMVGTFNLAIEVRRKHFARRQVRQPAPPPSA